MIKKIALIILILTISVQSMANCVYSTDIRLMDDGNYSYSKPCHVKMGENVRDLKISLQQNKLLNEAITLKDLSLTKANERADLWQKTSYDLNSKIETIDSLYQRNKWLYFGLGVLATSAAVYGAGKLK